VDKELGFPAMRQFLVYSPMADNDPTMKVNHNKLKKVKSEKSSDTLNGLVALFKMEFYYKKIIFKL